jgi:S-DNA-T family DNA segregation ATPase FtsK/SpoIIIE
MRKERLNEIWGVIFLLCGLFTTASLFFFHKLDVPFYTSTPATPVLNRTGLIGAFLAQGLLVSFGLASYLIPFLFLVWSWCFFTQRVPERKIFKLVGLGMALVAASIFLAISVFPELRFARAGAVGYVLGSRLLRYFGLIGSYIVTGSCFLLALLLATDFLIYPLVRGAVLRLQESFAQVFDALRRVVGWVQEVGVRLHRPGKENKAAVQERRERRPERPERQTEPRFKTYVPDEPIIRTNLREDKPVKEREGREKQEKPRSAETAKPETARGLEPAAREMTAKDVSGREKEPTGEALRIKASQSEEGTYRYPSSDLLRKPEASTIHADDLRGNSRIVEETLSEFGIEAKVVEVEQGPVITRYELLPAPGVKVNRIISLGDDLALALKATSLRFIAPIPGKSAIGIEVPNTKTTAVFLRELIESREFRNGSLALPLAIGKDTSGKPLIADLTQMPHLLIAGTTGSGKTVCVNSIIAGLLYHSSPERLKFVMIDPKMVELAVYHPIPHMLAPVVTDTKKAAATLGWVVAEMENRYKLLASRGVRNIQAFNTQSDEIMPYIVVVIDELADLMMVAQDKVEGAIARLAQLSRAVGIHLILATQRPSVDVITGVIKANFPARISFKVASKVDSRTVLDGNGADKLLGKGDLLFLLPGEAKLIRGQGAFVVDEEISRVAQFVAQQRSPEYHPEINALQEERGGGGTQEKDEVFDDAVQVVLETGVASASTLQRRLRLGYTRAARIIDQMEAEGIVGPHRGSKPRDILVDREEALRQPTPQQ